MDRKAKIYVAGHRGLVGSAIVRNLRAKGFTNLVLRTHGELELMNEQATQAFFEAEKPRFVFMAAARVGGIVANNTYPAEFIRENLAVQTNIIHSAYLTQVDRVLFLGSSCIYPKMAVQPMREDALLTGPLEPTNRAYALAKIAGVEMCWSYNRQYGTRYLSAMPTNLYGPGDTYNLENSHVIPSLLRKFHEAKQKGEGSVTVWGTGTPRREFMYSDDMADACIHLMCLPDERFCALLGSDETRTGRFEPPLVNVGVGRDMTIRELAETVRSTVGYPGEIVFDVTKPDGTPRKLMDVSLLSSTGWHATTPFEQGLKVAYRDFVDSL